MTEGRLGDGGGGTGGLQEGTGNRTEMEGGLNGTSVHTTRLPAPPSQRLLALLLPRHI